MRFQGLELHRLGAELSLDARLVTVSDELKETPVPACAFCSSKAIARSTCGSPHKRR